MPVQTKRLSIILLSILGLLLVPFVAMQLSEEITWSPFDFMVAGVLLLALGLTVEITLRKVKTPGRRGAILFSVILLFALLWVELAVGLFGSPLAGN